MDQQRHHLRKPLTSLAAGAAAGVLVALSEHRFCSAIGWWAGPLVVVGAAVWAWSLRIADTTIEQPGGIAFLHCCAAASVYVCVPETDQMKGVGLLVAGVLLLELIARERLHIGWHAATAITIVWAGLYGSSGRGSALVGAIFAVWPLLVPAAVGASVAAALLGVVGTWLESRTGAIQPTTQPAVMGAALWGGTTALLALAGRVKGDRPSSRNASAPSVAPEHH